METKFKSIRFECHGRIEKRPEEDEEIFAMSCVPNAEGVWKQAVLTILPLHSLSASLKNASVKACSAGLGLGEEYVPYHNRGGHLKEERL